jgi:quercetin dioxygenase-like cupin family protein
MKVVNIHDVKEPKQLLLVNDLLKVYYLSFAKGEGLPHHSLNGVGIIQVLEGAISIKFDTGESYELKQGDLFEFKSSVLHTVEALADTKLLLTNASYSN